jgi:hypothetical protein
MKCKTIMAFNGGKLYHIFEAERGEDGFYGYTSTFISDKAKEALETGDIYLKVDGENAMIKREDGEWKFYRRQDNYKGKETTIPLPDGLQPAHYSQGGKEHNYSYLYVSPEWTTGKGKRRSFPGPDTYAVIQKGVEIGLLPDPASDDCPRFITCEWVGRKHQKNMDGIPVDHALVPHIPPFTPKLTYNPVTFDSFSVLARTKVFEGMVIRHSDGTLFKLRSDMIRGNLWGSIKHKPLEPRATDISPLVLTKDGALGQWVKMDIFYDGEMSFPAESE